MHFMIKMFKCFGTTIFYCLTYSILMKNVYCMIGPDLTILNVTENRIHVEWTLINNPEITIEKYQVSAYPIKSYSKKDKFGGNEWTFYNTTFRSDLVGLHPGTLYNISVWATTNKGHTDPTTKNVWTEIGDPNPLSPVEIIERNGQTMLINIPAGQNDNGPITSYEVIVLEKNSIVIFNPDELTDYKQAEKSGLPFYVAAALTPEDANSSFTVGDSKHYNGYFNAPLSADKDYDILVGVVSSLNGIRKVSYSPLQSDMENQNLGDIPKVPSSTLSVILSAAIGVFGFLLVLSVIIYFMLRKRYGKRRPSDEMVLRVHGSDGDENGFVMKMLEITEDTDLNEVYERLKEYFWQIPRNHLTVHEIVLGIGHFGEVREGSVNRKKITIPAVVHYMQAPSLLSEKEQRILLYELDILSRVGCHSNIMDFIGICEDREQLYVVFEYNSSSLRGMLLRSRQTSGEKQLTPQVFLELVFNIAQGMAHLMHREIYHRRLSARNVIITEGFIPKIANFGLGYYNPLGKKLLYTRWTAPEVLNNSTFTSKSDVWSFGVLIWEILTLGGSPYSNLATREILPKLTQGTRLPQPKGISDELYQLMLHCWELDYDERPKFTELATLLEEMSLNAKEHINIDACLEPPFEKFDLNAEDH